MVKITISRCRLLHCIPYISFNLFPIFSKIDISLSDVTIVSGKTDSAEQFYMFGNRKQSLRAKSGEKKYLVRA